jgi:hypothetical protein
LLTPKETKIAVSSLLDQIQIAIDEIKDKTSNSSLPPFLKAEVTLSTEATMSTEGKASFYLSAKGGLQNSQSNTISFVLAPGERKMLTQTETSGQKIAEYVIATVNAIDENGYLQLKNLTVTAGLRVEEMKGGGVSVELVGVSVEGGRTYSSSTGHTLKLVFGYPEK